MRRDTWVDFFPDFSDLMTRLSRLKLSARLCNLGLNPNAARPLARFLSRLSRTDVQTFQTRAVGANLQFGLSPDEARPLARLMSRLSRPYVQTFPTRTLGVNVQFGSKSGCGATLARLMSTLSRSYIQTFPAQTLGANLQFGCKSGCGATLGGFLSRVFIFMTRVSGLKLSARLCNLGPNPEAARPLARCLPRLFRPYDKTFRAETLGATLQFGSKSGSGATLGTILVQTVQNLCADFPDSNCWRKSAVWV